MKESDDVAEVLDRAVQLIEDQGWWDGRACRNGAHCAATAIRDASGLSTDACPNAVYALREFIGAPANGGIPRWNDNSDCETVLETMRACANQHR